MSGDQRPAPDNQPHKPLSALPLSALPLDPDSAIPLHRQLCDRLREAILTGQLAGGMRLPGTRTLATELGVSRNTVLNAFEQLFAEGYVEGKVGAGTYVACALPDNLLHVSNDGPRREPPASSARSLSQRGQLIAGLDICSQGSYGKPLAFQPGLPALDAFPVRLWARLTAQRLRQPSADLLRYGSPAGFWPLREAIAAYLESARGVRCTTEQVIITAGSQQAMDIAARLLLDPGDVVWFENPGYPGARAAFQAAGAQIVPIAIDDEGLAIAAGKGQAPAPRMIYVSPSHQFPTGTIMSLQRRLELLEWAEQVGAWILEDDYNSEFRYAGRPLSALQGLDSAGRVIYLGTFSKVLLPTLRLGYVVVPPDLYDAFHNARGLTDIHSPPLEQAIVADFITEGHFGQHIRRMRTLYAERQACLLDQVQRELGDWLAMAASETGMHLIGWLPPDSNDQAIAQHALAHGVFAPAISAYMLAGSPPLDHSGLLLGYAAVDEPAIRQGVQQLAHVLDQALDKEHSRTRRNTGPADRFV
jgi:GntR family transcriptional regulator/MocR family aminotransferase